MASHPERPDRPSEPDSPTARVEALSIEGTLLRGGALVDPKALVVDGRRLIKIFVSYAHEDKALKEELLRRLAVRLKLSADYRFEIWDDREIHPGELWHEGIQAAIAECDYGLLLVSYEFLTRDYILESELPFFVSADSGKPARKRSIPVALKSVTFRRKVNFHGLDKSQIFHLDLERAFAEGRKQEEFAEALFGRILALAEKQFPLTPPDATEPTGSPEVPEPLAVRPTEPSSFEAFDRPPIPWTGAPIDPEKTLPNRAMETSLRKSESESPATFGKPVEALAFLRDWVTDPTQPPFCALLGEYGMGKTTTCEMFTRRLIEDRKSNPRLPIPIYLDLRRLGDDAKKSPLLEDTLRIVATQTYGDAPPAGEIKELVQSGRAVAIFDGLDEVLVHLTEAQGKRFTRQLWSILPLRRTAAKEGEPPGPRGKLVISCRTHYFRTLREEKNHFLGEDREAISASDYRALVLLPFTTQQIEEYLAKNLPGEDVEKLFDLIRSIHNLEELAERPYTLKLIAEHIPKLEQWKLDGRKVTGVTLYREMVASWLERDAGKHTLTMDHKLSLMERFSAELWISGKRSWSAKDIEQWLMNFLADPQVREHYEGKDRELLKEDLRTATFLVRDGEEGFRFAHTSLQEFFLATHLHRALREKRFEAWQIPRPSPETLDFLGQLIAEKDKKEVLAAFRELRGAYRPQASELMLAYALRAGEKGHPAPSLAGFRLDGAQLKGWTIASPEGSPRLDFHGASFKGANLHGAKLHQIDASDADFEGADLTCAELIGGVAKGARFGQAVLAGTVFRDLDLAGSSFEGVRFHRTQWLRCDLAGVSGLEGARGVLFAGCKPDGWSTRPDRAYARLVALEGHRDFVFSCAWSADGKRLASAGADGTVRVWDAETGEASLFLDGHRGKVFSCAWSADGKRLASAGGDGTVRVWDAETAEASLVLEGHRGSVLSCVWSADGKRIASAGSDGAVRVWDAETAEASLVVKGHRGSVLSCAWSWDGKHLASAGNDGTVRVWDAETAKASLILKGHRGSVRSCAWSWDGKHLASAGDDGTVRVWDAEIAEASLVLEGHRGFVRCCAWSGDGKCLASAGDDGTVRVWDAETGEASLVLRGHWYKVSSCGWSRDGKRLASAGDDGTVRVWDAETAEASLVLEGHRGEVRSCAWSGDGRRLASAGSDGTVRVWGAETAKASLVLKGHRGFVRCCAWSADGKHLASAGNDGTVRVWDAETAEASLILIGHRGEALSCVWSADGKRLASAGSDGTVRVWDAATAGASLVLEGHRGSVWSCAWSGDGKRLASAGGDGTVRVWDAETAEALRVLVGHGDWVRSCAWSGDGTRLASAGSNGTVRVWDAETEKVSLILKGHRGFVRCCAWSADGKRLASAGADGTVRVWDAETEKVPLILEGHQGSVESCAWSVDGKRLASAGVDGTVRVWDVETGREIGRIKMLPAGEVAVFFGPDLALSYASSGAWRWLGWLAPDPETGVITRYPAEIFGPLPGPDANGGFRER